MLIDVHFAQIDEGARTRLRWQIGASLVIGLACSAVLVGVDAVFAVRFATAMGLMCSGVFLMRGASPRAAAPVRAHDDGAVVVGLRSQEPAGAVLSVVGVLALLVPMVLDPSFGPGMRWAVGAVCGLFLFLLPPFLRAALRRPRVRLTTEAIHYRGWSVDAQLAWDDLAHVDVRPQALAPPFVVLRARPGAPSYRWRRRWTLLTLERKAPPDELLIPRHHLDRPTELTAMAMLMSETPPHQRGAYLGQRGADVLRGPGPRC